MIHNSGKPGQWWSITFSVVYNQENWKQGEPESSNNNTFKVQNNLVYYHDPLIKLPWRIVLACVLVIHIRDAL